MKYRLFNNGRSWQAMPDDYVQQDGEVLFDHVPTADERASVFPDYNTNQLIAYAAKKRFALETGGITMGGVQVLTDRDSQAMIGNAFASAKDDPTFTTKWKGADGNFVPLDNATLLAIGRAVRDHVNACFSKEADVVAGIKADPQTIGSEASIDAAFATIAV